MAPDSSNAAIAAANRYYCLNQFINGISKLKYFTNNYDDYHLGNEGELSRTDELRREAQAAIREVRVNQNLI